MLFAFELWREYKLSIAEITQVFPNGKPLFCNTDVYLLENITKEEVLSQSKQLWWTIKIIEVKEVFWEYENIMENEFWLSTHEGKFHYAINMYGTKKTTVKDLLKLSKNIIKEHGKNPRFINQDFKNISSVQIIKEALVKKWTDFNFIFDSDRIFFWNTLFVQDIYGYSNRDYWKDRDMHIGMLPPKLAQIMLNLGKTHNASPTIYDPFVWLWTVLIEAIHMGIQNVFWSDLNPRMVETSEKNLNSLKNFSFHKSIFLQNAKYIHEVSILNTIDSIVTEWYLWEIMTKNNISYERIEKQQKKLADLYEWFFFWLKKVGYKWNIVISFPFWEVQWKYTYCNEIYEIIEKYCTILSLLPENIPFTVTKSKSLLYKRDSQLVGREIFLLNIK